MPIDLGATVQRILHTESVSLPAPEVRSDYSEADVVDRSRAARTRLLWREDLREACSDTEER